MFRSDPDKRSSRRGARGRRLPATLLAVLSGVWMPWQTRGEWVSETPDAYVVQTDFYSAVCSKTTGLCDLNDAQGQPVFTNAGDVYVGQWLGREFLPVEMGDEAWILRSSFPVADHSVAIHGDEAVVTLVQTGGGVRFTSTFGFRRTSSRVTYTAGLNYLQQMQVTDEVIETGLPFASRVVDRFDQPGFVGSAQLDPLDTAEGWVPYDNTEVAVEPDLRKEGPASLKLTLHDDGDGVADTLGVSKSFASVSFPTATHLSFWVYPTSKLRIAAGVTRNGATTSSNSMYLEPNRWTLFQWKISTVGLTATNITRLAITAADNGGFLPGTEAVVFIDDIRFSDDITDGLYTARLDYANWYGWTSQAGTLSLDDATFAEGNASMRWSGVDLSANRYLMQVTKAGHAWGGDRMPADVSPWDALVLRVRTTLPMTLEIQMEDTWARKRFMTYTLPAGQWCDLYWYYKDEGRGSVIDFTRMSVMHIVAKVSSGGGLTTIWFDDLRLEACPPGARIFDAQGSAYARTGRSTVYSARRLRTPGGMLVADALGAHGIEALEIGHARRAVRAFLRHVDFHTVTAQVGRNGSVNPAITYYKEQTRQAGESVEGTVVFEMAPPLAGELVKARYPRAHRMGYTISDDDFYLRTSQAVYLGTSDPSSPDYGHKGIVGRNLMTTKNLWYELAPSDGGGVYAANPTAKAFIDLLHQRGVEIAMHTPGWLADTRAAARPALENLRTVYGLRQWVDHSPGNNPEALGWKGMFPVVGGAPNDGDDGYYMLDLLGQNEVDLTWSMSTSFVPAEAPNCTMFLNRYVNGSPLPHTSQLLGRTASGRPILSFGRSRGRGGQEYLQRLNGGDIAELQELIALEGLVFVYTHAHMSFTTRVNGHEVLRPDIDAVFAWLQSRQDDGQIWIRPLGTIVDWMRDLEKVVITDAGDTGVVVRNGADRPMRGVTLRSLGQPIRSARAGGLVQVYVSDDLVVLPEMPPATSLALDVEFGAYDGSLPRLSHVDAHVDVRRADFDPSTGELTLGLAAATLHDRQAKAVRLTYPEAAFEARDNGHLFARVQGGGLVESDPAYEVSLGSGGVLEFRLPALTENEVRITRFQPTYDGDYDLDEDGVVDQFEIGRLLDCLTGPGLPQSSQLCRETDRDADGDVDMTDFSLFQACLSEEGGAAQPGCVW